MKYAAAAAAAHSTTEAAGGTRTRTRTRTALAPVAAVCREPAEVTEDDIRWVAAVLDVKGNIQRKNNSARAEGSPQLVLRVDSKNLRAIARLESLTGVKADRKDPVEASTSSSPAKSRRPCSEHCPEPHIHAPHPKFHLLPVTGVWAVTGTAAAVVAHNIIPHLEDPRPYRTLMQEALQHATLQGRGSGETRKSLIRLIHLGWELPPSLQERAGRDDVWEVTNALAEVQAAAAAVAAAAAAAACKVGGDIDMDGETANENWARQDTSSMQRYLAAHEASGWQYAGEVTVADGSRHPVFRSTADAHAHN